MATIAEVLALAVQHHRAGNLAQADNLYQLVLHHDPANVRGLFLRGVLADQQGRRQEALDWLSRAAALAPNDPLCQNSLGLVYFGLGRVDEAVACHRYAVQLCPDYPEAHYNLGNALRQQNLFEDAVAAYREALRLRPNFIEALNNLGEALREQRRLDEAIATLEQALKFEPNHAEGLNNLAVFLLERGHVERAAARCQQALQLRPHYAEAHVTLGSIFLELRRWDEAEASCREALRLKPDYPEAFKTLGDVLAGVGKLDEALVCFQESLRLKPEDPVAHSSLLTCLNYAPSCTPADLLAAHCRWAERYAQGPALTPMNSPKRNRRLRIGYVSPDFRRHPVADFLEPILRHHNAQEIEVICYADVGNPDDITSRLRSLVQHWHPTHGLSDDRLVELIRSDGIDLLVDLAGHYRGNRLRAFACKPAPIQITYLGYPGTTGLDAIDYRLTDAVADPPGEPVAHSEELWRLPGCFCCYAPPPQAPAVSTLPALQKQYLTFASLHKLIKLNGLVLDLWCRLLHAIPRSHLLIYRDALTGQVQERLGQEFSRRGISVDRVEMRHAVRRDKQSHLEIYRETDVLLDTTPWSGHTIACEALWMGVPVLTLAGDRHAGRMVRSVLTCVGLTEWVAETPEEFIARGVQGTANLSELAERRRSLREAMQASPLCDGAAFTRRLEAAFRSMWHRWCASRGA